MLLWSARTMWMPSPGRADRRPESGQVGEPSVFETPARRPLSIPSHSIPVCRATRPRGRTARAASGGGGRRLPRKTSRTQPIRSPLNATRGRDSSGMNRTKIPSSSAGACGTRAPPSGRPMRKRLRNRRRPPTAPPHPAGDPPAGSPTAACRGGRRPTSSGRPPRASRFRDREVPSSFSPAGASSIGDATDLGTGTETGIRSVVGEGGAPGNVVLQS